MRPARRSVMRQILSRQGELDADGLQHAAADLMFVGIVAEERQVRRPTAGGDARPDGLVQAADAARHQAIHVRRVGCLQGRRAAGLHRQPPQAVQDYHGDLARILDHQFAQTHQICHLLLVVCCQPAGLPHRPRKALARQHLGQPVHIHVDRLALGDHFLEWR
jgi:hypothetical protein